MKYRKIRLAVIFDQLLRVGGGYQQALNVSIQINKINNFYTPVYFTLYFQNVSILKEYGIDVTHIKISKFNRALLKIRSLIYSEFFLDYIQKLFGFNKFEKYLLNKNIDLVYFLSPSNWSNYLENLNFIFPLYFFVCMKILRTWSSICKSHFDVFSNCFQTHPENKYITLIVTPCLICKWWYISS